MAAGSKVGVTPGVGVNLATGPTYTESASTVQDEKAILGEQYLPTFSVTSGFGISAATAASHLIQIGGGSRYYLRRLTVTQVAGATTAFMADIILLRLTTNGSGGTALTPAPHDLADTSTMGAMTLPTTKGTEGVGIWRQSCYFFQTVPVSGGPGTGVVLDLNFDTDLRGRPPICPVGASNYFALKLNTAPAAATVVVYARWTEIPF